MTALEGSTSTIRTAAVRSNRAFRLRGIRRWLPELVIILGIFGVWTLLTTVGNINPSVVPPPWAVVQYMASNPEVFVGATALTAGTIFAGIAVGMVAGILLAVMSWWSPVLAGIAGPAADALRAIPIVVLIPITARALGYGVTTSIAVTALLCSFPTFVMLKTALNSAPKARYDLFATFGARKSQFLLQAAFPGSLRSLAVALQLCAVLAASAATLTEYVTGTGGLGRLIGIARFAPNGTYINWAVAMIATTLAYLLYLGTQWLIDRTSTVVTA